MVKSFIGYAGSWSGNNTFILPLGNNLSQDDVKYNPPLKVNFANYHDALDLYCKYVAIDVEEDKLKDSNIKGFKKVKAEDCTIMEITKKQFDEKEKEYNG